ncbi:hypothetical protein PYCCODRAFT_1458371 [Trametes coccinea BRFM310]|uniref:DUF6533 domain-containing protein n=1 Tax=Trametes coccinea (strain BRFM310) TaxID=1353009 RepID=A0A1Y2IRM9_TRAC3|nr:hypothetical protein PYCCODRAFT_1458371 [Trametes coccinea BRFM310]
MSGSIVWEGLTAQDIVTVYEELWIPQVHYMDVASITLVVYDYLLTCSAELQVVWRRKYSLPSMLYLLNRYGLFVAISVYYLADMVTWKTDKSCQVLSMTLDILVSLLYMIYAAFSALRVHAINNRNWWWTSLVFCLGLVAVPGNLASYNSDIVTGYPLVTACFAPMDTGGTVIDATVWKRYEFAARACLILMDVIVLAITWYRTVDVVRAARKANIKSSLMSVMLRDGSMYFAIGFVLNIVDIVTVISSLNSIAWQVLVINSVGMSRFLLSLRMADMSACGPPDELTTLWAHQLQDSPSRSLHYIGASLQFASVEDPDGESFALLEERS